jgi:hypothetical protein
LMIQVRCFIYKVKLGLNCWTIMLSHVMKKVNVIQHLIWISLLESQKLIPVVLVRKDMDVNEHERLTNFTWLCGIFLVFVFINVNSTCIAVLHFTVTVRYVELYFLNVFCLSWFDF